MNPVGVRFAVSPIAWINDDLPSLGAGTRIETILGAARDIGFSGVELGGSFPRRPEVLGPLLARHGLALAGGWYGASLLRRDAEAEIAAAADHLDLLKSLDCGVFICAETSNTVHQDRAAPLSAAPRLDEACWRSFAARLTDFADHVAGQGLAFAYHQHLGTVVERAEDLETFLTLTGANVGLTVDTAHLALAGVDTADLIAAHSERIAHVHCKDVRWAVREAMRARPTSFLDGVLAGVFTAPGDGDFDFGRVMTVLSRIDYEGWIVIEAEQDPARADPRKLSEIGLATLRRDALRARLIAEERR
jgi:inosose dehydratase